MREKVREGTEIINIRTKKRDIITGLSGKRNIIISI